MTKRKPYPAWICSDCGDKWGRRECHIATWHTGPCDICGKTTWVTEPRDYGHHQGWMGKAMTDEAKALVEQCKGHTPGPWAANPFIAQVDSGQLDGSDLIPIAQLLWPTELRSEAETQANARLMAAAPEMLDLIETQAREIERLREVLTQIADGTMPRPLGKPWRMDMTSSKHDRCAHGAWMYEPCEGCIDAFIAAALEGKQ